MSVIQHTSKRYFWKMVQQTSKSLTKNDICYFRYFLILKSIWNSEQKRVRPDIFGICPVDCSLSVWRNCFQFKLTLSQTSRVCGQIQKISGLTRFCSEVTNIIFDQTLWCLLYHFSKIPLWSVLYHGHRLIDVESILIKQPCVCFAPFFVECGWILIIFFCWYLTKNASGLSRTFGTGNWWRSIQAISECNQFSCLWWKIKYRISIARGPFIKDYLWRKIEVGTLYFSTKSRLTTPPGIACNYQNIVNLPQSILARDIVFCISSSM